MYPYLLVVLLFQTSSAPVPLLRNCADTERPLGVLQASSVVRVRSAMAGEAGTCYAVSVTMDGNPVEGYVLGEKLPAIADFERRRREEALASTTRLVARARLAAEAQLAGDIILAKLPAPRERPHRPAFGDFSAVDLKGKPIRLSQQKGKVVVVCFWSPNSPASVRELLALSRAFFKLRDQGLDVIAVSLDARRNDIEDVLEGSTPFPDIADQYGIAAAHGVASESVPRTFILDQRREIVSTGLHGSALEDTIRETLKSE